MEETKQVNQSAPTPMRTMGQQITPTKPVQQQTPQNQKQSNSAYIKTTLKKILPEKYFKRAGVGCAVIIGILIGFALIYITGLDTIFFKLKMEGLVVNENGLVPIENAKIIVNGEVRATTNEDGYYKMTGLNKGNLSLTVEADGFFSDDVDVKLNRTTSNYTTIASFKLSSSEVGTLSGKFVVEKIGYDFSEDKIMIGEKANAINTDGSFEIKEIPIGEITFQYESASYFDISQTITLNTGDNKLKDIALEPAGDIDERFLNYITGLPISDVKIEANNITDDKISVSEEGNLKIEDLEIGKTYLLRISSDGYITRDYELVVDQGVNRISNLAMVETGEIFYTNGTDEDDDYQIFSSEYDGENLQQRTILDKLSPFRIYQTENAVRFLSTIDRLRGTSNRDNIPIVYELNTNTDEIQKITSNTAGLDIVYIDIDRAHFINVFKEDRKDLTSKIEIRQLNGSLVDVITTIDTGSVQTAFASNDGKFAYYLVNNTLYGWNGSGPREIISGEEIALYDVSENGNIALFTSLESTGFYSLNSYNFATKEIRELDSNTFGKLFDFIDNSDNNFIYVDSFNKKESIYSFDIEANKATKLVELQQNDVVKSMRFVDSKIFYVTKDRGLSVLDMEVPRVYVPTNTSQFILF